MDIKVLLTTKLTVRDLQHNSKALKILNIYVNTVQFRISSIVQLVDVSLNTLLLCTVVYNLSLRQTIIWVFIYMYLNNFHTYLTLTKYLIKIFKIVEEKFSLATWYMPWILGYVVTRYSFILTYVTQTPKT